MQKRKLIEVALPLEAINRESAREKSIKQALNDQMDKTANTSSSQVKLKSLEANAAGLRAAGVVQWTVVIMGI